MYNMGQEKSTNRYPPLFRVSKVGGVEDLLAVESVLEGGGVSDLGAGFTEGLDGLAGEVVEGTGPDIVRNDRDAAGAIDEGHVLELLLVASGSDKGLVAIHNERSPGSDRGDLVFTPTGIEGGEGNDSVGGPPVLRGKAEEEGAEVIGLVGLLFPGDWVLARRDHGGHGSGDGVDLPEEPADGIDGVGAKRTKQPSPGMALGPPVPGALG